MHGGAGRGGGATGAIRGGARASVISVAVPAAGEQRKNLRERRCGSIPERARRATAQICRCDVVIREALRP
ncbi:hypothetical protein, partial [Sphingomonas sp. CCH9-F2]|uniref:hypothetical protein n=1 Tax=Sphingomonas sp. CCH9-F2 TaxID=1768778 RepID=UPI001E399BE1